MKFKNYVLTIMKALVLTAMTVGLANCAKDDNNSGSASTYYMGANGSCYQTVNGQAVVVNNTYCSNTTSAYSYNQYNQCIVTSTGQQVAASFCTNSGTGNYVMSGNQCYQVSGTQYIPVNYTYCMNQGGATTSQACSGVYYYNNQQYNCGVTHNCSGVVMQNQYGQSVRCL